MAEMPELVELHHEWEARGVRVLAVSIDLALPEQVTTAEQLGAFLRRRELDLPVVAYAGDFDALTDRHGLPGGPPSTLVFDRAGREVGRIEGSGEKAEFEALLESALER